MPVICQIYVYVQQTAYTKGGGDLRKINVSIFFKYSLPYVIHELILFNATDWMSKLCDTLPLVSWGPFEVIGTLLNFHELI